MNIPQPWAIVPPQPALHQILVPFVQRISITFQNEPLIGNFLAIYDEQLNFAANVLNSRRIETQNIATLFPQRTVKTSPPIVQSRTFNSGNSKPQKIFELTKHGILVLQWYLTEIIPSWQTFTNGTTFFRDDRSFTMYCEFMSFLMQNATIIKNATNTLDIKQLNFANSPNCEHFLMERICDTEIHYLFSNWSTINNGSSLRMVSRLDTCDICGYTLYFTKLAKHLTSIEVVSLTRGGGIYDYSVGKGIVRRII